MLPDVRVDQPLVSVSIIAYNCKPYIRECLNSLVAQKTDFPFEICIGEDCSSDGTRETCIEYAERYPELIRLILRDREEPGRELYASQGVYNYIETTRECRGEYVAFCDGDDAWPDSCKLQEQVSLMRSDMGISLVHSDFDKVNSVTGKSVAGYNASNNVRLGDLRDKQLGIVDIALGKYTIAASSVMTRTADVIDIFNSNKELFEKLPMGDTQTWCELLVRGKIHYVNKAYALYRVTKESASNSLSARRKSKFVNGTADLGLKLLENYELPEREILAYKIKSCNRYALLHGDIVEISALYSKYFNAFSGPEKILYWITRVPPARLLAAALYQIRYITNHLKI